MKEEHYNVIGVMSGLLWMELTCTHSISINNKKWTFHVIKMRLFRIIQPGNTLKTAVDSETELEELNHEYTTLLASISSFITRHKIQNIQAVCSHGHTILHQPIKGITSNWKFTYPFRPTRTNRSLRF
jgi:anhydro-N-acetylmuramic acid kinase